MRRIGLLNLALILITSSASGMENMPKYETRYYLIYTDLGPEQARIAAIRMDEMAEEYARRMSDFGPQVRKKLPFHLFSDPEDYYATGAPRESAGRFNGNALLAVAQDFGPKTWHIVQHEGFHQFAAAVINANLPPWVNEGLAEYFGEGVFTGDGYVTGAIPQWRLERIRRRFQKDEFKPLREMMSLPAGEWNNELSLVNYDQAWSMIQFLAHGEDGKYQKALSSFLGQLGRGENWQKAWSSTFGDTAGFEEKWHGYWTNLPDSPTADVYARATVAVLTSFLARGFSQQQTFADFDAFARAGAARQIKAAREDWLPPGLLADALKTAQTLVVAGATFSIHTPTGQRLPQVTCRLSDGVRLIGKFTIKQGTVGDVTVERAGE